MTTRTTVTFMDVTYTPAAVGITMPQGTVSLLNRTGAQLAVIHNLAASNLGRKGTERFKDNKSAVKRTWQMLCDLADQIDAENAQETGEEPRDADGFEMTQTELDAQATRQAVRAGKESEQPAPAVVLSDADKAQITQEAASRPAPAKTAAKRGSQAGTIRAPRAPKADDGAIRLPTEGGKQRAKRQKDGSYAFRIPATKPRTTVASPEREELIGLLVGDGATWADIVAQLKKPDDANHFKAVTTVTMMCITLGYGMETQPDGTIKLLEPLA